MSVKSIILILTVIVSAYKENCCKANPLTGDTRGVRPYEFPYIVSIGGVYYMDRTQPFGHFCGGALITNKYILTAEHCFSRDDQPQHILVRIGSGDLLNMTPYDVERWVTFDEWASKRPQQRSRYRFNNRDIAILELSRAANINFALPKISMLCPSSFIGRTVVTAGWGVYDSLPNQLSSTTLTQASFRVLPTRSCNYGTLVYGENLICTNGTGSLPALLDAGDSGSPLLAKNGNDYEIIGVNIESARVHRTPEQMLEEKNIHISVSFYRQFIKSVAKVSYL